MQFSISYLFCVRDGRCSRRLVRSTEQSEAPHSPTAAKQRARPNICVNEASVGDFYFRVCFLD